MIKLQAFAKINLTLQVIGKREDGFHEIDSIMQSISLSDEINLYQDNTGLSIEIDDKSIPTDKRNTAYRAAQVFFDKTGLKPQVRIVIKKKIPKEAGLGGGSADAAAVLIGLNQLYMTNLSESDLSVLGAEVGSDVPFCLVGGMCRCRGRGELVEPITNVQFPMTNFYVLVKPNISISTKWVYENFDLVWISEKRLVGTHHQMDTISLFNDLEKAVLPKYPEINNLKKRLIQLGCLQALMTGSGSAVYGLAPDIKTAQKVYDEIKKEYQQAFIVEPVAPGVKVIS